MVVIVRRPPRILPSTVYSLVLRLAVALVSVSCVGDPPTVTVPGVPASQAADEVSSAYCAHLEACMGYAIPECTARVRPQLCGADGCADGRTVPDGSLDRCLAAIDGIPCAANVFPDDCRLFR